MPSGTARSRNRTPGPAASGARKEKPAGRAPSGAHQETSASVNETAAPSATSEAKATAESFDGIAPRRMTDVCCLLVFIAFNCGLVHLAMHSRKHGDHRRLTHGFDFRGHLCGIAETGRSAGNFTYWCNKDGHILWSSPVCVHECPDFGNTVYCPTGPAVEEEKEIVSDGSVVLLTTKQHKLVPTTTVATQQLQQFCLPKELGRSALLNLVARGQGSLPGVAQRVLAEVTSLASAPRLLLALTVAAFVSGFLWVFVMQTLGVALAHIGFVVASLSLLVTGALILLAPHADSIAAMATDGTMANHISSLVGENSGAAAAIRHAVNSDSAAAIRTAVTRSLSSAADGAIALQDSASGYVSMWKEATYLSSWLDTEFSQTVRYGFGCFFIVAGVVVALWYCIAKRSIAVAAACLREGCHCALACPSLILLLPLLNFVLEGFAVLWVAYGVVLLLTTAEVTPSSLNILGETLVGIHRSFDWDVDLVAGLFCWFFALLWYQEIVKAWRSFILSCTATERYFNRGSALPLLKGAVVAVVFHFGSLSFGAFVFACLRAVRWILTGLAKLTSGEDKKNRCRRCLLVGLDLVLACAQQIMSRISDSAFTHMALTSESFLTSSRKASRIMLQNASLVSMRSLVLGPMLFLGTCCYSATFGWLVYVLLSSRDDGGVSGLLPTVLREEFDALESPRAAAAVAGIICFCVLRLYTATVTALTDAVLYCFLWDVQDGVVDAEKAPAAFKAFADAVFGKKK